MIDLGKARKTEGHGRTVSMHRPVFIMAGQSKGACPSEAQLNRSAYVIQTEEKTLKTA